jgi:predicted AlkP superfamily phosphohydrolase/phosphomutase
LRLYLIGLDGLSANIVLADEYGNRWPNIMEFFNSGIYGNCECEEEFVFTGPSWTSIFTGQPARVHMMTDLWGRPIDGGQTFSTVKTPYIWDILNKHGLSCGVITMPVTYPAKRLNGYMISGFPSPKLSVTGGIEVPEGFIVDHSQLIRLTNQVEGLGYSFHDKYSLEEDIELLRKSETKKITFVSQLANNREVEALFVQYSCLDRIGHELNNYARRGITYDHNRILEMYDWFDAECLPRILEIEGECRVIVSDHGWRSYQQGGTGRRFDGAPVWGEHDIGGVLAIAGDDILPRTRLDCRNIDVMPTILDALDLPPEEVTGRSILTRSSDLEEINKRLSDLGYI